MRTSPREAREVISQLRSAPGFRHYVQMLEARKDEAISLLLTCKPEDIESYRQKARAYDELLTEIKRADTIL